MVLDMAGPVECPTLGGACWVVVIVDQYSRYTLTGLLKSKEIVPVLRETAAMIENQHGRKISHLHTDNGGEFVNKELRAFTQEQGMIHTTTAPHRPQMNGMAERMIQTIFNGVRCMLHDAPALNSPVP